MTKSETTTDASDEAVTERLRELTEALVLSREVLGECRGMAAMFDDLDAWQQEYRVEISTPPASVEGSTCPCRICGEVIDGVPTTTGHSVRITLPHDHFAYIEVSASSTLPGTGAFCARCVTSAALTILTHGESWAGEKYLGGSGEAIKPPDGNEEETHE